MSRNPKSAIAICLSQPQPNLPDLQRALFYMAQEAAHARMVAFKASGSYHALTVTSFGTVTDDVPFVTLPVKNAADATQSITNAAFTTFKASVDDIMDEIGTYLNNAAEAVFPGTFSTNISGTPNYTIAAVAAFSGSSSGPFIEAKSAAAAFTLARNNVAALAAFTNALAVATGLETIADNSGGVFETMIGPNGREFARYYPFEAAVTTTDLAAAASVASMQAAKSSLLNALATVLNKAVTVVGSPQQKPRVYAVSALPATRGPVIEVTDGADQTLA
ncbi:hypothetical protein RCDURKIN_59 [Rhodobacter phage RcDurkin]|nr:hypothetical protein RCDURKIN_59 [Rhodobacter phage RcDurkin]UUV44430.1 hypothetical protein RCMENCHIE_61 [Rhodobacter phage RcMenchie]